MARQVGYPIRHSEWQKATEEFAALVEEKVAAKEREAIIDLVAFYGGPVDLEAAIRARGEQA
jgi:hypothetical protein